MFNKCARYRRLKLLSEDGRTSPRQEAYVVDHEQTCSKCTAEHSLTESAMEYLRTSAIEPTPDPTFESRFIRRWRVERRSRVVSYWMPAVVGAVVASVALLAVIQILFSSPIKRSIDLQGREAQLNIPSYGETVVSDPAR